MVILCYYCGVPAKRFAISMDEKLAKAVTKAAGDESDGNLSAWLAKAARAQLRQRAMREALKAYEAEHGEISAEEVEKAAALWR
jgi:hypothetical protein